MKEGIKIMGDKMVEIINGVGSKQDTVFYLTIIVTYTVESHDKKERKGIFMTELTFIGNFEKLDGVNKGNEDSDVV